MHPLQHIIVGLLLGIIILPTTGVYLSGVFFIGSIFPDTDHIISYAINTGSINPLEAYRYYTSEHVRPTYILHTYEAMITLILLSIYTRSKTIRVFTLGFLFHMLTDIGQEYFAHEVMMKPGLLLNLIL